jgi:hypothetical protein
MLYAAMFRVGECYCYILSAQDVTLCAAVSDGRGRFHVALLRTGDKPSVINEEAASNKLEVLHLLTIQEKAASLNGIEKTFSQAYGIHFIHYIQYDAERASYLAYMEYVYITKLGHVFM